MTHGNSVTMATAEMSHPFDLSLLPISRHAADVSKVSLINVEQIRNVRLLSPQFTEYVTCHKKAKGHMEVIIIDHDCADSKLVIDTLHMGIWLYLLNLWPFQCVNCLK